MQLQMHDKNFKILNCEQQEIIFTSGGSEANNLAILIFKNMQTKENIL